VQVNLQGAYTINNRSLLPASYQVRLYMILCHKIFLRISQLPFF